jgi:hypothetical protein
LKLLRHDVSARSRKRADLRLPEAAKLIVNISKSNRLQEKFFEMVGKVLKENQTACMVLIDHGYPAFKRQSKIQNVSLIPMSHSVRKRGICVIYSISIFCNQQLFQLFRQEYLEGSKFRI